ncbi:SDR family NAD(P)-dependent oxidoreductase [Nocardia sp. NPDC049149]|uniref:SDR family NAD(P)-dependent oxidoreductase n=1 Tax=Nocardia sp. NPDC049149 TaxID=3364315 RepID=UPI003711229C
MFSLEKKVCVVTGAASGIGRATAQRLARAGALVVVSDIADASGLAAEIGGKFIRTDVSDEASVAALMNEAASLQGHLDICVNNAGIMTEAPLLETTAADFDKMIDVNAHSVLFGLKHAAPHMTNGGAIVNTASLAGRTGFPAYAAYAASKAAIISLTQVAAIEYGPLGIRVNCVCPSSVDTPQLSSTPGGEIERTLSKIASPLGITISPEQIAAAIHFLAADDSAAISGQALNLDGGATAGYSENLIGTVVANATVG